MGMSRWASLVDAQLAACYLAQFTQHSSGGKQKGFGSPGAAWLEAVRALGRPLPILR